MSMYLSVVGGCDGGHLVSIDGVILEEILHFLRHFGRCETSMPPDAQILFDHRIPKQMSEDVCRPSRNTIECDGVLSQL